MSGEEEKVMEIVGHSEARTPKTQRFCTLLKRSRMSSTTISFASKDKSSSRIGREPTGLSVLSVLLKGKVLEI